MNLGENWSDETGIPAGPPLRKFHWMATSSCRPNGRQTSNWLYLPWTTTSRRWVCEPHHLHKNAVKATCQGSCVISQMFVDARLLGHRALTGAHCGALVLWCKGAAVQNKWHAKQCKGCFCLESMLTSVSEGPKLSPNQVVWHIFFLSSSPTMRCMKN